MAEHDGSSEREAFDRLYHAQGPPVRNFLRLAVGNVSVADDLTQETFLHLWRRRDAFDPKRGEMRAYLLGSHERKPQTGGGAIERIQQQ